MKTALARSSMASYCEKAKSRMMKKLLFHLLNVYIRAIKLYITVKKISLY